MKSKVLSDLCSIFSAYEDLDAPISGDERKMSGSSSSVANQSANLPEFKVPDAVPSTEQLKNLIMIMPSSWVVGYPPTIFKWTCCQDWWEKIDTKSDETAQKKRLCSNEGQNHWSTDEPDCLAELINNCSGHGYWTAKQVSYSIESVIPPQSLITKKNGTDQVVVSGYFKTQNPLDCTAECLQNPCCLRPVYIPRRWLCVIFGASNGYPACTSKMEGEYEWSIIISVDRLAGKNEPVMFWEFVCCSPNPRMHLSEHLETSVSDDFGNEETNSNSPIPNICLCPSSVGERIELRSMVDLFCPHKQKARFALSTTAMMFDPTRMMVASRGSSAKWIEPTEINRDRLEVAGQKTVWVPVRTNLYPHLRLWAGPLQSLTKCSMLNCRVHVDNAVRQGDLLDGHRTLNRRINLELTAITNRKLYHLSLGWSTIAYNYIIGNDGRIYEGRGWRYIGSHTRGQNEGSIGISFVGWYPFSAPSVQALSSFWVLLKYLTSGGLLSPKFTIYGHRDLRLSSSPGLGLNHLIHTFNEITTSEEVELEDQCPSDESKVSAQTILIISLLIALVVILVLVCALVCVYVNHEVNKRLNSGLGMELLSHTTDCQEWYKVCHRVAEEREKFGLVRVYTHYQYTENISYDSPSELSTYSGQIFSEESEGEKNSPDVNAKGSTDNVSILSADENQFDLSRKNTTNRAKSEDLAQNLKLFSKEQFVRGYCRPAAVKIYLACDPQLGEPGFAHVLQTIGLFCRSWRELLIKTELMPRLFLDSLCTLCRQLLGTSMTSPQICVELIINSLDFLVLVRSAHGTGRKSVQTELLSDQCQVAPPVNRSSSSGICWLFKKFHCPRCELCRALPSLYQYSNRTPIQVHTVRIKRRLFWPRFTNYTSARARKEKSYKIESQRQTEDEFWTRFGSRGAPYAKLITPLHGRISTYSEYRVFKESQRLLRG
ncbi:unnamed protein product [Calicophoron daubneyi]|uniref:Uncharacterized protein n=1 Tax=Calicophoron daubneyi TaxID=300641 RepID=A0AAV2TSD7_CALDB